MVTGDEIEKIKSFRSWSCYLRLHGHLDKCIHYYMRSDVTQKCKYTIQPNHIIHEWLMSNLTNLIHCQSREISSAYGYGYCNWAIATLGLDLQLGSRGHTFMLLVLVLAPLSTRVVLLSFHSIGMSGTKIQTKPSCWLSCYIDVKWIIKETISP